MKKIHCFMLFAALLFLLSVSVSAATALAYFDEEEDPYLEEVVVTPEFVYFDDEPAEVVVQVKCKDEVRDKLHYQWCYRYWDEDENMQQVEVEGANQPSFTPTMELIEKSYVFICLITVEGDSQYERDVWAYYYQADEVIDLTKQEYNDLVTEKEEFFYVKHIKGAETTKAMLIRFKERGFDGNIIDAAGNSFYVDSWEETELEIQGNECYVQGYMYGQQYLGISSIEEKETFTRKARTLEIQEYPDKISYKPGEVVDLTGLVLCRSYNDGTEEAVPVSEVTWDKDKALTTSDYYIEVTDMVSGLKCRIYLNVGYSYEVSMKVQPEDIFLAEEVQRAEVAVEDPELEMKYLWVLYYANGEVAAELEDDTESGIVLPAYLQSGNYRLCCYYYTEESGFQRNQYVSSYFYVVGKDAFKEYSDLPQSPHSYSGKYEKTIKGYLYREEGAASLSVTFSEKTFFDLGDELKIFDGNGDVYSYTAKELAGKTVEVQGDTLKMLMCVQPESSAWGFSVTNVTAHEAKKDEGTVPSVTPTSSPTPQATPTPAPKAEKISVGTARVKVKAKKKKITVTIDKVKGAKGYQIQYAKAGKVKKSKYTSQLSCPIKKLKKGTYSVRVRAYKLDSNKKKVFGKWSKVKKVKIK